MVAQSWEDGEEALMCVKVEGTRSKSNLKKSGTEGLTNIDRAVYSAVCLLRVMMVWGRQVNIWTAGEGNTRHRLYSDDCG